MLTIGKLAKAFGLSRGTLLHYDSIGLLSPSVRTDANYRLYSEDDRRKLELICTYRAAGLKLADIARLLEGKRKSGYQAILQERLRELSEEIAGLQEQQHLIARILQEDKLKKPSNVIDKDQWVDMLRTAGLDEEGMHAWHRAFEKRSGEAHHRFLRSLGISEKEIGEIRDWSID